MLVMVFFFFFSFVCQGDVDLSIMGRYLFCVRGSGGLHLLGLVCATGHRY